MRGCLVYGCLLLGACAQRQQPPAATQPTTVIMPDVAAAVEQQPEQVDLSPAPAPEELAILFTAPGPAAALKHLSALSSDSDIREMGQADPRFLAGAFLGEQWSDRVRTDLPIYVAGLGTGDDIDLVGSVAVDVNLHDPPPALQLQRIGAGRWSTHGQSASGDKLACELWRSNGPSVLRLVCSNTPKALATAGPYLTRTAPTRRSTHLATMEVFGTAFAAAGKTQRLAARSPADAAIAHLVGGTIGDPNSSFKLAADFDEPGVRFTIEVSNTAPDHLAHVLLAGTGQAAPLPKVFWELPKEAQCGIYYQGAHPDKMAPLGAAALKKLFHDAASSQPEEQRQEVADLAHRFVLKGGPFLLGHGFDIKRARQLLSNIATARGRKRAVQHFPLWYALHVNDDWTTYKKYWKRLLTHPLKLDDATSANGDGDGDRTNAGSGGPEQDTHMSLTQSAGPLLGAPRGAIHTVTYNKPLKTSKRKPIPYREHIVAFPRPAGGVWIVWGVDGKTVARAAANLNKPKHTIVTRPELARLRNSSGAGGGFCSALGLMTLDVDHATPEDLKTVAASLARHSTAASKHDGPAPAVFNAFTTTEGKTAKLTLTATEAASAWRQLFDLVTLFDADADGEPQTAPAAP